jgi:putative ATPase
MDYQRTPLAERVRPESLEDFLGQEEVVGKDSFLRRALENDRLPSLIFWGPPGSGKTTLAHLIAKHTKAEFVKLSAVGAGVKELRAILEKAEAGKRLGGHTILFIDEIHRWNKAQQDALLPHVEKGTVTLIGATTENPSFEVNSALLSRTQVVVLKQHSDKSLSQLIENTLAKSKELFGEKISIEKTAEKFLIAISGGDARRLLSTLEATANFVLTQKKKKITNSVISEVVKRSHTLYDKEGEYHYDIISALHKSVRGGDANASLYWLARMLEGGEEPLYIARRIVRMASEDIGLANSQALPQAIAAYQACQFLGMPECEIHLAQAVVYMAMSKKSNALYTAYGKVKQDVRDFPNEPVPIHLRNAPTKLMKELGYGKDYKYTPDYKDPKDAEQEYLPEKLKGRRYVKI